MHQIESGLYKRKGAAGIKPIGVSEYQLTEKIPAAMKGKLPTIKQIEKELKDINEPKQNQTM